MYALVILMFVTGSGMAATSVPGFASEKACKEAAFEVMNVAKADTTKAVCVKVK